jgi:hypothetical protein
VLAIASVGQSCLSQLPCAGIGCPRTLRVVDQSRGFYHTPSRLDSRRDGSKASPGLTLDADDCGSLTFC